MALLLLIVPAVGIATPGMAVTPPDELATAQCPPTRIVLPPLPALRSELGAGVPLVIVALGSSSTEGAGASHPHAAYPVRLEAALRRALPGVALRVINAGRSGETSEEMLARLDADVLVHHPDLVIWQASGNEVLRGRAPAEFLSAMRAGIARLRGAGAEIVLMDNQRAPRIETAPLGRLYEDTMRRLAASERVALFARSTLMRFWAAEGLAPADVLAPDDLHHNDHGYACLARALAAALVDSALPVDDILLAAR